MFGKIHKNQKNQQIQSQSQYSHTNLSQLQRIQNQNKDQQNYVFDQKENIHHDNQKDKAISSNCGQDKLSDNKQNCAVQSPKKIVKTIESLAKKPETQQQIQKIYKSPGKKNQCAQSASALLKINSINSNNDNQILDNKKHQQTGSDFTKNVHFQQISCDEDQNQNLPSTGSKFNIQQLYQSFQTQACQNVQNQQLNKKSLMSCICSFLQIRLRRKKTQIQNKLLNLNVMKVTGTKKQQTILLQIAQLLLFEKHSMQNMNWKKIGFPSNKPLKQLQSEGILTILQWRCFISSHQEKALKMANFCIEMNCSLFYFHKYVTQAFCEQLMKNKIIGTSWKQFQESYNNLLLNTFEIVTQKSRKNPNNIQEQIINTLKKSKLIKLTAFKPLSN